MRRARLFSGIWSIRTLHHSRTRWNCSGGRHHRVILSAFSQNWCGSSVCQGMGSQAEEAVGTKGRTAFSRQKVIVSI